MLRLWNRLIHMPNDRLTKQVFLAEYHCPNPWWSGGIREVLSLIDKDSLYLDLEKCNLDNCGELLMKVAEKECLAIIEIKPKLRTFKTFKTDCSATNYVKWSMNRYDRSMLAKFCCGILQLRIDTGRFNQTKLEERTCEICNSNLIEDEFHFLCVCTKYNLARECLFNRMSDKYPEFPNLGIFDKFKFILKKSDRELTKFLRTAWETRKLQLYK